MNEVATFMDEGVRVLSATSFWFFFFPSQLYAIYMLVCLVLDTVFFKYMQRWTVMIYSI